MAGSSRASPRFIQAATAWLSTRNSSACSGSGTPASFGPVQSSMTRRRASSPSSTSGWRTSTLDSGRTCSKRRAPRWFCSSARRISPAFPRRCARQLRRPPPATVRPVDGRFSIPAPASIPSSPGLPDGTCARRCGGCSPCAATAPAGTTTNRSSPRSSSCVRSAPSSLAIRRMRTGRWRTRWRKRRSAPSR